MKIIEFNTKQIILSAVYKLAQAVGSTLGAGGRNALIQMGREYAITKDGVTVAKQIELEDESENAVAQIIRDAAIRTARDAGDGTTTSTVLVYEIVKEILENPDFKTSNVTSVRKGINDAAKDVLSVIKGFKKEITTNEEIKSIATISGNNDEFIGNMMLDVYTAVGKEGAVRIEETQQNDTKVDVIHGCQLESGYININFSTNDTRKTMEYKNPFIFITDKKFDNRFTEIIPPLEIAAKAKRPLIYICGGMEGEPEGTLVANKLRHGMQVGVIQAPYFGSERWDILDDLAAATGGVVVSEHRGMSIEDVTEEMLGTCDSIIADANTTTIIGRHGSEEEINKRIEYIKSQEAEDVNNEMTWRLKQRMASLTAGVGIIRVGGRSESEMKDVYYRIEDALAATKAALNSGYVLGGGMSYFKAAKSLKRKRGGNGYALGYNAVLYACGSPLKWIINNAGDDYLQLHSTLVSLEDNWGYDAVSCKICNISEKGIIDPFKVVESCINNSSSVASMLITTNVIITDQNKRK